mmetsp:Transcript_12778/g.30233  ORF Transcript_12778/g.30233 Transcript_12778/m.30233 type:complete len:283 (-) Transcript_12778:945-1793(-)
MLPCPPMTLSFRALKKTWAPKPPRATLTLSKMGSSLARRNCQPSSTIIDMRLTMTEGSSCTWWPRTLLMKLRMFTPARPWPTSRSAFISNIFSVTSAMNVSRSRTRGWVGDMPRIASPKSRPRKLMIELKKLPTSPLMRVSKLAARPASRNTMCGARAPASPKMSHRCRRWYGPMASKRMRTLPGWRSAWMKLSLMSIFRKACSPTKARASPSAALTSSSCACARALACAACCCGDSTTVTCAASAPPPAEALRRIRSALAGSFSLCAAWAFRSSSPSALVR